MEEAGGKALPCIVDIRIEEQVEDAVKETVKKFGGIDILVNNASAISLTGTLQTPMKRYDLMNGINARGTYLWSVVTLLMVKWWFCALTVHIHNIDYSCIAHWIWTFGVEDELCNARQLKTTFCRSRLVCIVLVHRNYIGIPSRYIFDIFHSGIIWIRKTADYVYRY